MENTSTPAPAHKGGMSPVGKTILINSLVVFGVVLAANFTYDKWLKPMATKQA